MDIDLMKSKEAEFTKLQYENEDYEIAAGLVKVTLFIYILVCFGFLIYFLFN